MRIALIVPGGVDRSGRERVIPALLCLIERLAARHRLLVIALEQEATPASYDLLGSQVINLGRSPARLPGFGFGQRLRQSLAALAAHGGADVIHAFWLGATSTLALGVGRWRNIPVVASIGGGELTWLPDIGYGGAGSWRHRQQVRLAMRFAQAITGGSRFVLAPVLPIRPDARLVPLGVDVRRVAGDLPAVARPPGPPWRLLHAASINRVKDQATLLQALRLLADQAAEVHLDWFGGDTLGGELQRQVSALGLERHVTLHGVQTADVLLPYFRQAHLYVQSSRHESQGVAVCEAAAAGVPTVGTAVGLVAELAPHAAWAAPVGDAAGLAAGILTLLADPAERDRRGRAAQAWAQAFDADWTAAAFEAIYQEVIG